MNTIFGFILVLGVLIVVHEWGHYIVARLFGVRVDVFSIGFGPRLFGIKRGTTDWRVSAVPLGGYVRMAGQDITDIDSGDQKPTGAPDELLSKKRWQRALISLAGPVVNLIFPFFLLGGYFIFKGEPYLKYLDQPLTAVNLPKDSVSGKAGVQTGDHIISFEGVQNPTWGTLNTELEKGVADRTFHFTYEHDGQQHTAEISTAGVNDANLLFGPPPARAVIDTIDKRKPAYRAGIRSGDVIDTVDGSPVSNTREMIAAIQKAAGRPMQIVVHRKAQLLTFSVAPVQGKNERGEAAWLIGVVAGPEYSFRKVSPSQAVSTAAVDTVRFTYQVIDTVGKLITRKIAAKELQSFIGIANEAGRAVQEGTFAVVTLMAGLSLNLGILNLLPIPILDGGHILLLSLEGLRRRDFSLTFKERFIQVGLVFLLVLIAYVMYNDVMRILPLHS